MSKTTKIAVAVLIASMAIGFTAESWIPQVQAAPFVEPPPARYDHEPTKYYHVTHVPQNRINKLCGAELAAARIKYPQASVVGCSAHGFIWIVNGLSEKHEAEVLRHEKAHVNGWRH